MNVKLDESVEIRRMTEEDVDAVRHLDELSFPTPWPEPSFAYELNVNRNAHCWVADLPQAGVIGSLIIWLVLDEAHIATIAVHPDHRRKGVAQKLMTAGLIACIRMGARSAMLEVRENNQAAIEMYRKFGFERVGRRRQYYQDTKEDAILMTAKPLDEAYLERLGSGAVGRGDRDT